MSDVKMLSVSRKHAIAAGVCLAVAAVFLFIAGSLAGLLYAADHPSAFDQAVLARASQKDKALRTGGSKGTAASTSGLVVEKGSDVAAAAPGASAPPANMTTKPDAGIPATAGSGDGTSSAAGSGLPANSADSAGGSSGQPQGATEAAKTSEAGGNPAGGSAQAKVQDASYAIPLEVQVGSFRQKPHAEELAQSLKSLGYSPSMSLFTDANNRTWYVVRLGPYTRWDEATRTATRVAIAENVSPMIGPMR